jgi:hypothetical protein
MQLDHRFVENLTPARVDAVLAQARSTDGHAEAVAASTGTPGAMVLPPGPQVKRQRTSRGKAER